MKKSETEHLRNLSKSHQLVRKPGYELSLAHLVSACALVTGFMGSWFFKQARDPIGLVATPRGSSVDDELKEEIEDRKSREEAVIVLMDGGENLSWRQRWDIFGRLN